MVEQKVQRIQVAEGIDNVVAEVPKVTLPQITSAYDWHAKQLRLVDAAIQRANWETEIEVPFSVFDDYEENKKESV